MLFKEADLFKGLSREALNDIADHVTEENYSEGDLVIKEGDPADHFYILHEGRIRLTVGEKGHLASIVSNSGEIFGWSSLVDRDTYTASAECLAPCKLLKIEKEMMNRIFDKDPASGLTFFRRLSGVIGQRLLNTYRTLLSAYAGEGPPSYG